MNDRSALTTVRNPVMALPAVQRTASLNSDAWIALHDILIEVRDDARQRAQICWKRHKAPMACYWKAVSVYANHIARALRTIRRAESQP